MKQEYFLSQRLGFTNAQANTIRTMGVETFLKTSFETPTAIKIPVFLENAPKTRKEYRDLRQANEEQKKLVQVRGTVNHAITMQDPEKFERQLKALKENLDDPMDENPNLDFVRKLMINSFEGSDQIKKALEKSQKMIPFNRNSTEQYPKHGLAKNLEWIAKMVKGGLPTSVYYTGLGSFDTHANQLGKQKNLLSEVSESVKAFYDDMKAAGLKDNVTVMIFSEFGRRVKDNGSGTDHGTAAPLFIIGGGNKGQIIGKNPDLLNLDNGDLKHEFDFRNVYATLLKQKLNIDPTKVQLKAEILRGVF